MADTPTLPLFYTRLVGVNPTAHGALRMDRAAGFGFTAGATSIPLGLGEMALAARHYPVVFANGPVALVGLDEGGNLFVGPDGAWGGRGDAICGSLIARRRRWREMAFL